MRQPQGNGTSAVKLSGQSRTAAQSLESQEALVAELHGCSTWTATLWTHDHQVAAELLWWGQGILLHT